MGLFKRKRYTFSEKLRRRERRLQNTRELLLLGFCAIVGLWAFGAFGSASISSNAVEYAQARGFETTESLLTASLLTETKEAKRDAATARAALKRTPDSTPASSLRQKSLQSTLPGTTAIARPVVNSKSSFSARLGGLAQALQGSSVLPSKVTLADGSLVELTIDEDLQRAAIEFMKQYRVPFGAIVAVEPKSGRILALAGSSAAASTSDSYQFALRAGMPAASLIKVVSAAAAIEKGGATPRDQIHFRGGNYTLNKWNYKPDVRRDTRVISLAKALATSNNPAFGRVGVQVTGADLLSEYAQSFGFNSAIPFVLPLEKSEFGEIIDDYSLARAAAGFGEVTISPLHAAMVMAAIANDGRMMKPQLIHSITTTDGQSLRSESADTMYHVVNEATANSLLGMMELTIKSGTGRRQFSPRRAPKLRGVRIAAKTGTLSGKTPEGRYHWLIAAAPIEKPEIAVSALVVDTGNARINGSALGRLFLEYYFSHHADRTRKSA